MMFTKSLKHLQVTSTVCEVLTGLVYKVLPALASAPSPLHPEHKGLKTPVADAPWSKQAFHAFPFQRGKWRGEGEKVTITATDCAFSDKSVPTES